MNSNNALKLVAAFISLTGVGTVFAHGGHSQVGTHWHATDAWGFAVLGVAVAVWLSRGGK